MKLNRSFTLGKSGLFALDNGAIVVPPTPPTFQGLWHWNDASTDSSSVGRTWTTITPGTYNNSVKKLGSHSHLGSFWHIYKETMASMDPNTFDSEWATYAYFHATGTNFKIMENTDGVNTGIVTVTATNATTITFSCSNIKGGHSDNLNATATVDSTQDNWWWFVIKFNHTAKTIMLYGSNTSADATILATLTLVNTLGDGFYWANAPTTTPSLTATANVYLDETCMGFNLPLTPPTVELS